MPKVEDSTGFSVSTTGCKHPVLFFGAFGRYVICSACSQMWVALDPLTNQIADEPMPGAKLTDTDRRVDPETLCVPK